MSGRSRALLRHCSRKNRAAAIMGTFHDLDTVMVEINPLL